MPLKVQASVPSAVFRACTTLFAETMYKRPPETVGAERAGAESFASQISAPVRTSSALTRL